MSDTNKKIDIILVHIDTWMQSNNGLAILDPYLKMHGINCVLINSSDLDEYKDKADIFGFSVFNFNYRTAQELTHKVRNKTVIWGGWTPSAVPELMLQENPDVDYVILREGEKRLFNLLRSFEQPEIFDKIDGIAYRNHDNNITIRPPKEFMDMNELPRPNKLATVKNIVFIEVVRGCYGQCYYCQDVSTMRFKSACKIADEIQEWYLEGYTIFHLGNANSAANGPLLQELFIELESRNLPIRISLVGRPENFLKNLKIIEKLFQSKIIRPCAVEMGIEANSQRVLDLLGRRTTPEKNIEAVEAMLALRKKYAPDIKILTYMILFSHYDITIDDFVENVKFIGKYQCSRDVISLYLVGLRNTRIWDDMKARGFIKPGNELLQILRYNFTDDLVDRLFKKLVRVPLRKLSYEEKLNSPSGNIEFQRSIYDKIIEFYNSKDILKSIMDYIDSPSNETIINNMIRVLIDSEKTKT